MAKKKRKKAYNVEIVVAGHICLDVFPTLTGGVELFRPGQTVEAGPVVFATGGPVSNTGLALHKLAVPVRLMGKVGDDLFGQAILRILNERGPDLAADMIVAPGEASSYSIILSTPQADRMLIHAPGCNATYSADDVRYDTLAGARTYQHFHFGYPPLMQRMYADNGAELAAIFQRVQQMRLTTSLDLCMPDPASAAGRADWQAILIATLPYVDVFLPSAEEILFMLHRPLFEQFAALPDTIRPLQHITPTLVSEMGQQLLAMGAKIVALKLGERGLYLRTASADVLSSMSQYKINVAEWSNRELWMPCFAVDVVGTTGAGDATIAGFLTGFTFGMTPESSLEIACAVGACSVEAVDAISGIRTWSQIALRLAKGWPHLPLAFDIAQAGWHWDAENGVWIGPRDRA
ncbi:MAG TPA: carbohydrate kinase family protein [Ktedonobacteraceae bacterium]